MDTNDPEPYIWSSRKLPVTVQLPEALSRALTERVVQLNARGQRTSRQELLAVFLLDELSDDPTATIEKLHVYRTSRISEIPRQHAA